MKNVTDSIKPLGRVRSRITREKKDDALALLTLVGTIIGVGLYAVPYLIAQVGVAITTAYFLVVAVVAVVLHLLYAQIDVWTDGHHRLAGYSRLYLGKWGRRFGATISVAALLGTLLAYLVVGGNFLGQVLTTLWPGIDGTFIGVLVFFAIAAALVYFGTRTIAEVEVLAFVLFLGVIAAIVHQGHVFWEVGNLFSFNAERIFMPYGVALFSLWGISVIPEIVEMKRKKITDIRRIVSSGVAISTVLYVLFGILVAGITGSLTSPDALPAFKYFFGEGIIAFAFLFGFATCFTSFLTIGLTLTKTLWYDFQINRTLAWMMAMFVPLALYLIGFKQFIGILGAVGGILLGFEGIMILVMYRRAHTYARRTRRVDQETETELVYRLPWSLVALLTIALIVGIGYQVYTLFLG